MLFIEFRNKFTNFPIILNILVVYNNLHHLMQNYILHIRQAYFNLQIELKRCIHFSILKKIFLLTHLYAM